MRLQKPEKQSVTHDHEERESIEDSESLSPFESEFEELLTVEEAARALRIEEDTIRNWLRTGHLSGYKLGRGWRIARNDLKAFLAASKRNALEPVIH